MSYEQRPGDGTLFVNANKQKDTHPDRDGFVLAHRDIKAGEKVRLAGWIAKDRSGEVVKDKRGNPMLNLKMSDEQRRDEGGQSSGGSADEPMPF